MGMVYQFKVAKKSDIPEGTKDYYGVYEKFTNVGPEFDREDWIPGLVASHEINTRPYTKESITDAIEKLKRLDDEVKYILESNDINLDIDFRRRLANGLVSAIYGFREYHYDYPLSYYPESDYHHTMFDDNKDSYEWGSGHIQDTLKKLLPYATDEYVIWCCAF